MMIYINGNGREIAENSRVADVVAELGLTDKKIAIELNEDILPFQNFATQILNANDKLEIVHAIGGGQENDSFFIAGKGYQSSLFVCTGKYKDLE